MKFPVDLPDAVACPHCDGTGKRIVPPPPRPHGGDLGRGRTHGYEGTYQAGCRCALCRAAHRDYSAELKRRRKATAS